VGGNFFHICNTANTSPRSLKWKNDIEKLIFKPKVFAYSCMFGFYPLPLLAVVGDQPKILDFRRLNMTSFKKMDVMSQ
jgi:hypothetical protein